MPLSCIFKIKIYQCNAKMYWKLILKCPGFVPFRVNLTQFGPRSDTLSNWLIGKLSDSLRQTPQRYVNDTNYRQTLFYSIFPTGQVMSTARGKVSIYSELLGQGSLKWGHSRGSLGQTCSSSRATHFCNEEVWNISQAYHTQGCHIWSQVGQMD